jgi:hypothetical protein
MRRHSDALTVYKSEMIARTEVLASYSEAQEKFTREIWDEVEDGPLYKKWYTNRDRRAREDHKKMNGRVVRLEDTFKMKLKKGKTDELKYPGDRGANYRESIINCRCSYSTIPEELVPERQRRS